MTDSSFNQIFNSVQNQADIQVHLIHFQLYYFFCYYCVSDQLFPFLSSSAYNSPNKMPPKGKEIVEIPNTLIRPQVDFHHTPLVDRDCKIIESSSQFNLYEIYCWMEDQRVDQTDEIRLWDSHLPQ